MVTTGVIVAFVVMCSLLYVMWMGARTSPTSELLNEMAPIMAAAKSSKSSKSSKKMRRATSKSVATLACPNCGATRSRRGEFKTARSLAAHVGRCKSRKSSRSDKRSSK